MRKYQVVVYGSYGYTGKLIVDECKKVGLSVLLSGRDNEKLRLHAEHSRFDFDAVDINDKFGLRRILSAASLVINCAGPFQYTARQMVEACLETTTHYTDITGECEVFESLAHLDPQAKEKGICIMPGTGFDVVPTDCLAVHLKKRLPSATHLQLAFAMSKGGLSRGTSKTMVEGMGNGSMIRKDGKLTPIALGERVKSIDFGSFTMNAICIPWGDISTAYRSTGIPNIEVYSAVPVKTIKMAYFIKWFNWIIRQRWVKNYLLRKIDQRPAGPSEDKLENGRSFIWGRVWDEHGNAVESRLETMSGYKLTAKTATLIATKILKDHIAPGNYTPAQCFGEGLVLEVDNAKFSD